MKEIIKANEIAAPTLFVGVGGTGSEIIKQVAEMCQKSETENISFVCLDTNVNDLTTVAKSEAYIRRVQISNNQTVGNYLEYDTDARQNWFPKNTILYPKSVSEGAGQVRSISRLAMDSAIKTGKISPLYEAIDDLFRKDGSEMKQALRVVIVSTASGGTGSGILLPLSMFIRDYVNGKYPNTTAIVRMMIMLPETLDSVISSSTERESQRRNAYSTVKELNAFMMKGSGFMDFSQELQRYTNLHVDIPVAGSDALKSLSLLPCDFCFLIDGQNAEDNTMVDISQYITQAAQSLYEQNIGPMQKKAFSVEDNIIKEFSKPGIYGRNRFGGIGASVIRYPFSKVAEYIAYDWAIDSIGGEGEAAKWKRYDNEFERQQREADFKDLSEDEAPKRGDVYVATLLNGTDKFSRDLRSRYKLDDFDSKILQYMEALEEETVTRLSSNSAVLGNENLTQLLSRAIDYEGDASARGQAGENLLLLRSYEKIITSTAGKIGDNAAEAFFYGDNKAINSSKPYYIESILQNSRGYLAHPNAARFMLYKLQEQMNAKIDEFAEECQTYHSLLSGFAPTADNEEQFQVKFKHSETISSLDDYCDAEPTATGKRLKAAYKDYYENLNNFFQSYRNAIKAYGDAAAKLAVYKKGADYVKRTLAAYKSFFDTFTEKVVSMQRHQEAIVEGLKYKKGDSVLHVCSTEAMLKELTASTQTMREDGNMLDSELNGQIIDAIKQNVIFTREVQYSDVIEDDKRVDIFDDIIMQYFIDSVEDTCESIDMNIIEALACEKRLAARIRMREEQANRSHTKKEEDVIGERITQEDCEHYITEIISMGQRIAAPGIQRMSNVESREVVLMAYNSVLQEMRTYRMSDLIPKVITSAVSTDTVSRYELHFFNALYNLTADKISKFACESNYETGTRQAGLYHKAYHDYSKLIGPDSTKSDSISTHIDKRWDSLAVMPELDFDFQKRQVLFIQQAMIYGLLYGVITLRNYSKNNTKKKVYRYENSKEYLEDLVVSNQTACDEFYEILDSLYISPNIVDDLQITIASRSRRDRHRSERFQNTAFAKALESFVLPVAHESGTASLFEIPVMYYNSLPASLRFNDEVGALVDAVISTLEQELSAHENAEDVPFLLESQMKQQFDLLVENFNAHQAVSNGEALADHDAIDLVFRRIRRKINSFEVLDPDDLVAHMREALKK